MATQSENLFNELMRGTNSDFQYNDFATQLDAILEVQDPEQREEGMQTFYRSTLEYTAQNGILERAMMQLCGDAAYEEGLKKIHKSSVETELTIVNFINAYASEKGSSYQCKRRMGASNEEYEKLLVGIANNVTTDVVYDRFFRIGRTDMFVNAVEENSKAIPETHTFKGDLTESHDRNVAEIYAIYNHVKNRTKNAGIRGNLRHPIRFLKSWALTRRAESLFRRVGFDATKDGPNVLSALQGTKDYSALHDVDNIRDHRRSLEQAEARRNQRMAEPGRVAANKLENALENELTKGPDTAYATVKPIFDKYCAKFEQTSEGYLEFDSSISSILESFVNDHDVLTTFEHFENNAGLMFFKNLNNIFSAASVQAKENGTKFSISEMLKDVATVSAKLLDTFTVMYDAPESREVAKTSAFGCRPIDKLKTLVSNTLAKYEMKDLYTDDEIAREVETAFKEYKNPYLDRETKADKSAKDNIINETTNNTSVVNDERKPLTIPPEHLSTTDAKTLSPIQEKKEMVKESPAKT